MTNTDGTNADSGRILLSGGSGMLGSALRTALVQRNAELLQLVRREALGSREIQWNPASTSPLARTEALEGLAAAIHLSGANVAAHRWTARYQREIRASRLDSTHALATVLAGLRSPPRTLLLASAIGIYGDRGDEILDEEAAPGSGFLASVCREWEAAAEPARKAGIHVVPLRFGVVLGSGSGALAKMLPVFRLGLGGRIGPGTQWMSWIALEDVVAATLFILESPSLSGAVNLTAPHPVTNAEFTRTLGQMMRRPTVMAVPALALRAVMGLMAEETLLASARVIPKKLMEAGFRFGRPSLEEALGDAIGSSDRHESPP